MAMCAGNCTDTTQDPNNCGTCGHSCHGGLCQFKQCQPVTLASGQLMPSGIAVDGTIVYWTNFDPNAGAVMSVFTGTPGSANVVAKTSSPRAMTLDGNDVYWVQYLATNSAIWYVSKKGGTPVMMTSGQNTAYGIAVSATDVYWTCDKVGVNTIPKGTANGTATTFASSPGPNQLFVDTMNVYWTDYANGTVQQQSLMGGPTTYKQLAGTENVPFGITATSGNVYWAERETGMLGAGFLLTAAIGGGAVFPLDSKENEPQYVVSAGNDLYWNVDGGIMTYTIGKASSPAMFVSYSSLLLGLAADTTGAYWTTSDGNVLYLAK